MEKISVILPVFNRRHCIERALKSIHSQKWENLEICVGDDASTDGTPEFIQQLVPTAKIAVLPENRGAASARNAAMQLATGEFLAFLDSDDAWLPGKLARQVKALQTHPDCLCCATGHILVKKNGEHIARPGQDTENWRVSLQLAQSFHGASTPLVRREVLTLVGEQDESLRVLEDWDWMLRIALQGGIHLLPECLAEIYENQPSNPDATLLSTERFLQKHHALFEASGTQHARTILSQHRENAARNLILHDRSREAFEQLLLCVKAAPTRNLRALLGLVPAWMDRTFGTKLCAKLLA